MKKKTNNQINNNNKKVGRPIFAPPPPFHPNKNVRLCYIPLKDDRFVVHSILWKIFRIESFQYMFLYMGYWVVSIAL